MRFLPVFLDLTSGTVALVGSSAAAVNKLRLLRSAGASVRWYSGSADVAEEVLLAGAARGRLELSFADPLAADYSEFVAVVAATGSSLDQDVVAKARAHNVPINVVDRADLSTFISPRSSTAATWWSPSAPAAHRRCWRADCASGSRRRCRRASATSPS